MSRHPCWTKKKRSLLQNTYIWCYIFALPLRLELRFTWVALLAWGAGFVWFIFAHSCSKVYGITWCVFACFFLVFQWDVVVEATSLYPYQWAFLGSVDNVLHFLENSSGWLFLFSHRGDYSNISHRRLCPKKHF